MMGIFEKVKPGVLFGDDVKAVFEIAKANNYALPAINCIGSDSINGVLEAAKNVNSPVIIQFSNGGAAFVAGKGLKLDGQEAQIIGGVAGAKQV
ncbi:MAG: class II fructose-bisphosphate aldolase, partial [Lentisphaeria bacterium]|nr:class II fructose-bisphosphate aldolase [Lentisphaeria bacterium]